MYIYLIIVIKYRYISQWIHTSNADTTSGRKPATSGFFGFAIIITYIYTHTHTNMTDI